MYGRLTAATLLSFGLALAVAAPARADGGGFGYTDGPNVGAGASDGPSDPTPHGRTSSSSQRCEYQQLNPDDQVATDQMAIQALPWPKSDGPGSWYSRICYDGNGLSSATIVWVPQRVDPE